MIQATIAGETFVLPSLKDAELLLQLLERAIPVRTGYLEAPSFRPVVYRSEHEVEVSVDIRTCELLTRAQFDELLAADRAAKAAVAAATPATVEVAA